MKNRIYIYLLGSSLLLFIAQACSKIVDVSIETGGRQIVINGFISPGEDTIKIRISQSVPLGETSLSEKTSDAEVILSNGDRSIVLRYDTASNHYIALEKEFPIQQNEQYQLTVHTKNGLSAFAKCFVPAPINDFDILIDSIDVGGGTKDYFVRYQWQDISDQNNYYRVLGLTEKQHFSSELKKNIVQIRVISWADCKPQKAFLNDDQVDGEKIISPISNLQQPGHCLGGSVRYFKNTKLICSLLHTDKNYFLFHRSFLASQNTFSPNDAVILHSNIEGGFGIFAGYNKTEKIIQLN